MIGNQPAIKMVPEQPTTNIAKPIGTLTANREKRIGKANMPRYSLSMIIVCYFKADLKNIIDV